jgi:hypothetical protein
VVEKERRTFIQQDQIIVIVWIEPEATSNQCYRCGSSCRDGIVEESTSPEWILHDFPISEASLCHVPIKTIVTKENRRESQSDHYDTTFEISLQTSRHREEAEKLTAENTQ